MQATIDMHEHPEDETPIDFHPDMDHIDVQIGDVVVRLNYEQFERLWQSLKKYRTGPLEEKPKPKGPKWSGRNPVI